VIISNRSPTQSLDRWEQCIARQALNERTSMRFPVLDDYLRRLPRAAGADHRIWLDPNGHAQGSYFNCVLTSVFQPVRQFDTGKVVGHEAFVCSASEQDSALSIWKQLEGAASDNESIALDRLCRMLHAINFFRQLPDEKADLYLGVHERLLAAVSGSHGVVFRRVLAGLGLPVERIVLQMPPVRQGQQFVLNYVADNYRRSGFRVALTALDAADALKLAEQISPDVLKLDAGNIADTDSLEALAAQCALRGTVLVLEQAESLSVNYTPRNPGYLLAQGYSRDRPAAALEPSDGERERGGGTPLLRRHAGAAGARPDA
jgi:EAL domain-containing protein (putative c-di-GMP-specific phosphodiesterase class I)